jgi:hypothetical protein
MRGVALAALAVQGALLFSNLGLLPLWGDEFFTLRTIRQPLAEMFQTLRADLHPPLYFLALRYWVELPLPGDSLVRARTLSALFTLAASAFAMRLFLPRLSASGRMWLCALLACSPCLILYGRMARSYGLQTLLALFAIDRLLRLLQNPGRAASIAFGLTATLLLYVHYIPGIAIMGAANLALLVRLRRLAPLLLVNAVILAAYSPWIPSLRAGVSGWGELAPPGVTGGIVSEHVVRLGYWAMSFLFGESMPWWLLFAEIALAAPVAWLAWQGWPRLTPLRVVLLLAAAIGYAIVAPWLSYPFTPARMLFILPFVYLLLAHGAEASPRAARILLGALLATSALGLWSYFRVENYLNWGYAVPYQEIARDIAAGSRPALVTARLFTDVQVLPYYLPKDAVFRRIPFAVTANQAAAEMSEGPWARVCVVRNAHDVSSNGFNAKLESALILSFPSRKIHAYRPRTRLDRILGSVLGWKDVPPHFYEMVEFER